MLFLKENLPLEGTNLHIYNYICRNMKTVIYMRIRELSLATNVSTTTILRFCRKFQCRGYSEFKFRLQEYVHQQENVPGTHYDSTAAVNFLSHMNSPDFERLLLRASQALTEADMIFCVGLGASGIMANYASYLFSSLVSFAVTIDDPLNTPLYQLNHCHHKKLCILALSISGEQDNIVETIDSLNQYAPTVISITNTSDSTIARFSDINIACHIAPRYYYSMNITSQIPALAILERLAWQCHQLKAVEADVTTRS